MSKEKISKIHRMASFVRKKASVYEIKYDRPSMQIWKDQITIIGFIVGVASVSIFFVSFMNFYYSGLSEFRWFFLILIAIMGTYLSRKIICDFI